MIKLLRANFHRLKKDIIFYISIIVNTVLWVLFSGDEIGFDSIYLSVQPVVYSVFVSFYIGREYSSGAVRNKLICGHRRAEMYFAFLLTCIASVLVSVIPGAVIFIVKYYAFLSIIKPVTLVMLFLGFIFLHCACCSVFTAVSFNISNKSVCVVAVAVIAVWGMVSSELVYQKLLEPETVANIEITETHEIIDRGRKPNPDYVSGFPRKLLMACFDASPQSQLIEYSECLSSWNIYFESGQFDYDEYSGIGFKENDTVNRDIHYGFVLNQLAVIFISSLAGYYLFKRKNLK